MLDPLKSESTARKRTYLESRARVAGQPGHLCQIGRGWPRLEAPSLIWRWRGRACWRASGRGVGGSAAFHIEAHRPVDERLGLGRGGRSGRPRGHQAAVDAAIERLLGHRPPLAREVPIDVEPLGDAFDQDGRPAYRSTSSCGKAAIALMGDSAESSWLEYSRRASSSRGRRRVAAPAPPPPPRGARLLDKGVTPKPPIASCARA